MSESRELYGSAAGLCLRNASRLCSSADALAKEGDFARACALQILGLEEAGKGLAFRMIGDGQAHIEGSGWAQEFVVRVPFIGERRYRLYRHPEKREITFGYELWLLLPMFIRFLGIVSRATGRTPAPPSQSQAADEVLEEGPPTEEELAALTSRRATFSAEELERIKLGGLYVDVEGERVLDPSSYDAELYQDVKKFVSSSLDNMKAPIERGVIPAYTEELRQAFELWLSHDSADPSPPFGKGQR